MSWSPPGWSPGGGAGAAYSAVARSILVWPVLGRRVIQEQSTQTFTVRFLSARALSSPTTARWKLSRNGGLAQDWTEISTPESSETVTVSGALHTYPGTYEFVVQSDYGDATVRQSMSFRYEVKDLVGVS